MDGSPVLKAMFVDEVEIVATSGDGGRGCVAFRREKHVPHGGPNGGDGGDGGSVFLVADDSFNTLQHLAGRHHWAAERGEHGLGKGCHGKRGADLKILVPPGTLIYDADTGMLLRDLADQGQEICIAHGGKGGLGNTHFKSATNQAPREAEPGGPGRTRRLRLELKLIADVGLVGLPNAGKSTLLSRLSAARPKVAAYPFTTLYPCLGIVELPGHRRFVMADIPGLIEGAHGGAGLGDEFLRHVERTRLLVHMVDICPPTGDPVENYRVIRNELAQYSALLAEKPEIVVANKMDLTDSAQHAKDFTSAVGADVIAISAVTGKGLEALTERIWQHLQDTPSNAKAAQGRRSKKK
ncbi:MAG: GTPase ObgE [Planctomycetota bacterium]|nr:GTPase ObgE [Planctomycetota bacterium]